MKTAHKIGALLLITLLAFAGRSPAAPDARTEKPYDQLVQERLREGIDSILQNSRSGLENISPAWDLDGAPVFERQQEPRGSRRDLDLHPSNKQDVGKRLANLALAKTYGFKDIICDGPHFKSMKREGSKIRIAFETNGGDLKSRDGKPLDYFVIAGADRKFMPATAKIEGNEVVVSSDQVAEPVAVRFGWENDARPNLMNAAGLPAYPFRTDDWPLTDDTPNNH